MDGNETTPIVLFQPDVVYHGIEKIPAQERVANPVKYQYERSMADILTERAAEGSIMNFAPVFVP